MAKSRNFFGLRRGSTKTLTFQVNKGQQITKDRVYEVANPRTTQQMAQRLRFACAVQFFKHANQALFEYAFEDKKQLESDYNAFIRHNALNAGVVSRYMLERNYPAMGNFQMTQGSLGTFNVKYIEDSEDGQSFNNYVVDGFGFEVDEETTVGDIYREFLSANPQFENGDIITIVSICDENTVCVKSANEAIAKFALCYAREGVVKSPKWNIRQWKIDVDDTTNALNAPNRYMPWYVEELTADGYFPLVCVKADRSMLDSLSAVCMIVSRPVSASEVKVTSSALAVSSATQLALDVAKSTPWVEWCASTYEDSQLLLEADAILKGEIVESTENFNAVIADPTAKADGRKVATINRAENITPSALRVIVDISGAQKRIPLEENWYTGIDVVNYNSKFAGLVNDNALYSAYLGNGVEIFVPMSEGLIASGSVVAAASASTAFKLVSLSN